MRKKRLFGALLMVMALIVMLLPAAEADAETTASDFVIKDGKLESYKGKDTTVTIPNETDKDKIVKVIGASAFAGNTTIEKLILPDSVTQIEAYAFDGCEKLRTVELGKGLTKIDDYAFANCEGLETMDIPSNVRSIGTEAFADCERFESITIPPEVTSIKEDAFARDYLLNIYSEGGSYAAKYAVDFYSKQRNFVVKSGKLVEYKGTDTKVTVPDEVEVIGADAFANNTTVEKITLPDSVKQIEPYAFWGCEKLRTVELGKGLTQIDDYAFTNCDGLEEMTIPSNVRSIGIQSFSDCNILKNITIPPQVTSIKDNAFDRDYLLNIRCETGSYADKYAQEFYERQKDMAVYGDVTPDKPEVPEDGVYSGDPYPSDDNAQSGNDGTQDYNIGEILGSTKVVGNQAMVFMHNAGLPVLGGTDASLSETGGSVEEPWKVSERTHYRDEQYTEGSVGEDIREIGRFAYARSGLKNITLPDGLEKIEYAAFYHCDDLAAVELPESVTAVESKAFAHTAWVEDFMDGSDETEGDFLISGGVLVAYRGDSEEVTIPEGVRVIAGEAFMDHDEIRKLSVPETVQFVDDDAFIGCNPEEIEYGGVPFSELLSDLLVEEQINLSALNAAPRTVEKSSIGLPTTSTGFPIAWIAAGAMFLCGGLCILPKAW
ncbi:MAG: leucine-rich repeat domain-containing protein [Butyrivibrio sp.]|nr:leucine-rich repeat domain-containing protein [Muribaculum sp.]MCM1551976.1 leucine-rich repeat domain-containing protein [Butyrivibrio sp.]